MKTITIDEAMREDLGDPWKAMLELNRLLNDAFESTYYYEDIDLDLCEVRTTIANAILIAQRFLPIEQRHFTAWKDTE